MVPYFILGTFGFICLVHLVRYIEGKKAPSSDESFFEDDVHNPASKLDFDSMHIDPADPHYIDHIAPDPGNLSDDAFSGGMDVGGGINDPFN